jgi:Fe-S oxidoreductase
MWLDVQGDDRVENERSAEAANTGAETVVTGCPFCKVMLEAGRQSLEESDIEVLDLAELIVLAEGL